MFSLKLFIITICGSFLACLLFQLGVIYLYSIKRQFAENARRKLLAPNRSKTLEPNISYLDIDDSGILMNEQPDDPVDRRRRGKWTIKFD